MLERKIDRFPKDFIFQLSKVEFENLRSQIVTSGWDERIYTPYALTEQGVTIHSSVINNELVIKVYIAIMRA